jgi:3-hydroxybutyrate dehydrogenase
LVTPLVENQTADQAKARGIPEYEVIEKIMVETPPIKRPVEPEEVVELVVFLCAPETSVISGVSLTIDGGWTTR